MIPKFINIYINITVILYNRNITHSVTTKQEQPLQDYWVIAVGSGHYPLPALFVARLVVPGCRMNLLWALSTVVPHFPLLLLLGNPSRLYQVGHCVGWCCGGCSCFVVTLCVMFLLYSMTVILIYILINLGIIF